MLRRDYETLAEAVSKLPKTITKPSLIVTLESWLVSRNPGFDREKFREACLKGGG